MTDKISALISKLRDPSQATSWGLADNLMNDAANMLEAMRLVGVRQEQSIMKHEREIESLHRDAEQLRGLLAEARGWWGPPPDGSACAVTLNGCDGKNVRDWMTRVDAAMTGETR